jgi:protein involved in polysaccharide export with SLBB domain
MVTIFNQRKKLFQAPARCLIAIFLFGSSLLPAQVPSRMDLLDDHRALRVGDRLLYQVVEEQEPAVVLFVNDEGIIEVPLAGPVSAAKETCLSLAVKIRDILEKDFFHRATVLLRFQNAINSRGQLTLVGRVRTQGRMNIPADEILTVSNAILRAGGFAEGADRANVTLVRQDPEKGEIRLLLDVGKMLDNGNFQDDRIVRPDDTIIVPESEQAGGQIYIVGAVNNPGLYNIPPETSFTVSKAILNAGGFTRFANKRAVKLIRAEGTAPAANGEDDRTLIVDVERVLEKGLRDNDPELHPNDIIRIEERTFVF